MTITTSLITIAVGITACAQDNPTAAEWSLYKRDRKPHRVQNLDGGGIWFQFDESPLADPYASPPWDGYLLTCYGKVRRGGFAVKLWRLK